MLNFLLEKKNNFLKFSVRFFCIKFSVFFWMHGFNFFCSLKCVEVAILLVSSVYFRFEQCNLKSFQVDGSAYYFTMSKNFRKKYFQKFFLQI